MAAPELSRAWRKSSYSQPDGNNCVECSTTALPSSIAVRDSKHPDAGHLSFAAPEWSAFLTAVKRSGL